jgi:hypothetical protein
MHIVLKEHLTIQPQAVTHSWGIFATPTTGLLFCTYIALYLIRLTTIPTPARTPDIRPWHLVEQVENNGQSVQTLLCCLPMVALCYLLLHIGEDHTLYIYHDLVSLTGQITHPFNQFIHSMSLFFTLVPPDSPWVIPFCLSDRRWSRGRRLID